MALVAAAVAAAAVVVAAAAVVAAVRIDLIIVAPHIFRKRSLTHDHLCNYFVCNSLGIEADESGSMAVGPSIALTLLASTAVYLSQ